MNTLEDLYATPGTAIPSGGPGWYRWVLVALATATLFGLVFADPGLPGEEPDARPASGPVAVFDLAISSGAAQDLDGAAWRAARTPPYRMAEPLGFERPDLYRTSGGDQLLSGWDAAGDDRYSVVAQVPDDPDEATSDPTGDGVVTSAACDAVPVHQGSRVRMSRIRRGSRICVRTHQRRWVLLVVTQAPSGAEPLRVHAVAGGLPTAAR